MDLVGDNTAPPQAGSLNLTTWIRDDYHLPECRMSDKRNAQLSSSAAPTASLEDMISKRRQ